jgi:uncharacterized protein (TIGR00369 family)
MPYSPLDQFREFFMARVKSKTGNHFSALGLECRFIEAGRAGLDLPFKPELAGDAATGIVAGGPMTALLDSCCAIAAATAGDTIAFCPTLDLRMDHMAMPEPGKTLHAEAEAYRVTRSIIFTRGIIYQDDPERPVVRALVNFTPIGSKVMGGPSVHSQGHSQGRSQEEGPADGRGA